VWGVGGGGGEDLACSSVTTHSVTLFNWYTVACSSLGLSSVGISHRVYWGKVQILYKDQYPNVYTASSRKQKDLSLLLGS